MARTWIVVGDATTSGGRVITGSPATDIEGKPVARIGDKATCPTLHKGVFPIITGDASIVIDGQPVARQGDSLACGCRLLAGKQNLVYVDQGASSASGAGPLPLAATSLLRATPASASKSIAQASAPQPEDLTLHYHYNDLDQTPVRGASYRVMLADDSIRSGNLDDAGKAVLGNVSVGPIQVLYQHDLDDSDDADILGAREQIKQALDAIVAQTRTDFAAEWTQWNGSGYFTRAALKLGNQGLGAVQGGWDYVSGTAEAVWQLAVLYYKTDAELREWKMLLLTGDRAGLDRKIAEYRAQGKQVMAAASEMKEMFNLLIDDPAIVSMLPQFAEDWWAAIPPDEAENLKSRFGSQIAIDMLVSVVLAAVTIEAGGAGGIGYAAAKAGTMAARVGQKLFMLLEKLEDAFKALTKALRARKRRQADSNRQPNTKHEVVTVVTPKRMPEKKLPCFSTQKLPADKYPEMDRQLQGQQQGLNDMTVQEYLDGRAAFDPNNRDQKVARAARREFASDLAAEKTSHYTSQGIPPIEAKRLAKAETEETMKTLNALHNPDMVAGGKDIIADFGDGEVNTTIGRQWSQKKKDEVSRIQQLDQAANEVPHAERATSKMNGKMERCKKMSPMLDESFDYFYNHEGFGPQIDSKPVPESIVEAYRGKLPDALLTYWKAMGWAGFGNGLLWLVDPREYADVFNAWIYATDFYGKDRYHVFARGAFGNLYAWGERTGPSLRINAPNSMIFPSDKSAAMARGEADLLLQTWFIVCDKDAFDTEDNGDNPLFERAVELLGRPGPDEMFGFVPALALGGPRRLDHVQKVNAIEHLMFLAQVHPPRVMLDIVKEAKARGLM